MSKDAQVKEKQDAEEERARQARIEAHKDAFLKLYYGDDYRGRAAARSGDAANPARQQVQRNAASPASNTANGATSASSESDTSSFPNGTLPPVTGPSSSEALATRPSSPPRGPKEASPASARQSDPITISSPISAPRAAPQAHQAFATKRSRSEDYSGRTHPVPKRFRYGQRDGELQRRSAAPPTGSPHNQPPREASRAAPSAGPPLRSPPDWYTKINPEKISLKSRAPLVKVNRVWNLIFSAVNEYRNPPAQLELFSRIREEIHELEFMDVTAELIRKGNMLDNDRGLALLFDPPFRRGAELPWDIASDALELYNKWSQRMFDPDLLRGILTQPKLYDKSIKKKGWTIDPKYNKLSALHFGNGLLVNGQWWPRQICAVRDGAHGQMVAGIAGIKGGGAVSVVLSGSEYNQHDRDEGDEVWYSGTTSTDGISEATNFLILSVENKRPVRLMRSWNLPHSNYRPSHGFRYDGLYDVVGKELVNTRNHHYLFHLVRQANQTPIRYRGVGARPTTREISELQKVETQLGMRGSGYHV